MEIHDKIPAKPIWIILWIKCTIEWEFIDDHGISKGLIWEMMDKYHPTVDYVGYPLVNQQFAIEKGHRNS